MIGWFIINAWFCKFNNFACYRDKQIEVSNERYLHAIFKLTHLQGGPIKCYHFLNPCYFQNRFFLFSKILTTKHRILTPMDRKQYTVKERVKIVKAYFELKLVTQTQ